MTEKLKQAMHERATAPHFAPVDVAALVATGDRRLRRRRWAGVAAGAAAAVAVVAVASSLPGSSSRGTDPAGADDAPVVTGELPRDMFAQGRVTWAMGSVIHYGDVTVDVGRTVDAFVRTEIGFVYASDGAVWQVDGDAQARIGQVDAEHPRLVSDEEAPSAGWVDASGARPAFVVYDHGTGEITRYDEATTPGMGSLADERNPAYFYAIDDGTAYWRDERGAVATDLATGEATVVAADARNGFDVIDVEDGLIALGGDGPTRIRQADGTEVDLAEVYGSMADFSPSGRYYASDADTAQVSDSATGELLPLELDDRAFATAFSWVDDGTVVVLAARSESAPVELLTCALPSGACTVFADDLGTFEEITGSFQLPVGETIGDD